MGMLIILAVVDKHRRVVNSPYSNLSITFHLNTLDLSRLDVLKQICEAINNGYRTIILEAPTGFGKSPVAVSMGVTLGSSYICSATKDLQAQYA